MLNHSHNYIMCRRFEWLNFELVLVSRKCLQVRDINNDSMEKLEFPERVIQIAVGYKRIIAVTPAQCYIYSVSNFNTPNIMELGEGSVSIILASEKYVISQFINAL